MSTIRSSAISAEEEQVLIDTLSKPVMLPVEPVTGFLEEAVVLGPGEEYQVHETFERLDLTNLGSSLSYIKNYVVIKHVYHDDPENPNSFENRFAQRLRLKLVLEHTCGKDPTTASSYKNQYSKQGRRVSHTVQDDPKHPESYERGFTSEGLVAWCTYAQDPLNQRSFVSWWVPALSEVCRIYGPGGDEVRFKRYVPRRRKRPEGRTGFISQETYVRLFDPPEHLRKPTASE